MQRPIGVFDSGIGGLTVVKWLRAILPKEDVVYFGDTARVPYGTKSPETIKRYAVEDTRILLEHNPKLIIIACNTVSALALDEVQQTSYPTAAIGVVKAGARAAVASTKNFHISIIGTTATVGSLAYTGTIHNMLPHATISEFACPLFVPLAEEGFTEHHATTLIAESYLAPLKQMSPSPDTLVLGCTHYPTLHNIIQKVVGNNMTIVDSGELVAKEAQLYLIQNNLLSSKERGTMTLLFSDKPHSLHSIAKRFVGLDIEHSDIIINHKL